MLEKTKTDFSAYAKDYPIYTTGKSISELLDNDPAIVFRTFY